MPLPIILDTDMGTDVDDALALAYALRHPGIELRAVTTVSGDTERRARIARKLLRAAGRGDIPVFAGERGVVSAGRSPENGLEAAALGEDGGDFVPAPGDAVEYLIAQLATGDVEVAVVGMQSNMAEVARREPGLPARTRRIAVMGGVFGPVRNLGRVLPPTIDHNLNVDQEASVVALNAGYPTLWVPGDVTMDTWVTARQVDALRGGDALCRELVRMIQVWAPRQRSFYRGTSLPRHLVCLLHDPLTVACMVERRYVTVEPARVTVALHQGHIRTFIDPLEGVAAEVVTAVDAPAFADHWLETVLG